MEFESFDAGAFEAGVINADEVPEFANIDYFLDLDEGPPELRDYDAELDEID